MKKRQNPKPTKLHCHPIKTSSFYTTTSQQILKSQVLSLDLKEERELQDLSSNGSAFQTEGAAIVKDRPP